jgi:polyferredoxin
VSLPVLAEHSPAGVIRRSRSGRRRAVVLATVQALIIAHVVLWLLSRRLGWFAGYTTTPIEPSESMEFFKHGIVNAGAVFFAVALLSTLVLGRWFCGWGCHLVMLQDLCGWIMKKLGVRPRAFRARLLMWVPLILAIYMFFWPVLYRWGFQIGAAWGWWEERLPPWTVSAHLTTDEFWRTFAGALVAIPFLLVCGFAAVYFLGAKGFCTYGCPYGGLFAPLDRLAPGRIRVTDACEQCGHCTAVCTSNVRVHDEVREYGMVVDPGCMKCLDCVSVCPNEALYFGFGRPAVARGAARHERPVRRYDLSFKEEVVFFALFWLVFVAVRDLYNMVPMLFAAGLAGCVTFLAWKLWRLVRDPNVTLHRWPLKQRGVMHRSGWISLAVVVALLLLTAHSAAVTACRFAGDWCARGVRVDGDVLFGDVPPPDAATVARAERAIRWYTRASSLREGGLGLAGNVNVDWPLAHMYAALHDFDQTERVLRQAIERRGRQQAFCQDLAFVLRGTGRGREAARWYLDVLATERDYVKMLNDFGRWCQELGHFDTLIGLCRTRLERFPDHVPTLWWSSHAHMGLGLTLHNAGRSEEALLVLGQGHAIDPGHEQIMEQIGGILHALGRPEESQVWVERINELRARRGGAPP